MGNNPMDIFNKLVENPEAVDEIKKLIGNLDLSQPGNEEKSRENEEKGNSGLGGDDVIQKMSGLFNDFSTPNNPTVNLLNALTPFLSGKRAQSVGKIANIARMGTIINRMGRG